MYLVLLNNEKKELFLNLACRIAAVDGNFSDEENAMIDGYCQEMNISFDYNRPLNTTEKIVSDMNSICDLTEKRIIIFEIIGLAMADGEYDVSERGVINGINKTFALPEGYPADCEKKLKEYFDIQRKLNSLVIG